MFIETKIGTGPPERPGFIVTTTSSETVFYSSLEEIRAALVREKSDLKKSSWGSSLLWILGSASLIAGSAGIFEPSSAPIAAGFLLFYGSSEAGKYRNENGEAIKSRIWEFEKTFPDLKPIQIDLKANLRSLLTENKWTFGGIGLSMVLAAGALVSNVITGEFNPYLTVLVPVPAIIGFLKDKTDPKS